MRCKAFENYVYKINWESEKITSTLKFKLAPKYQKGYINLQKYASYIDKLFGMYQIY